MQTLLCVLHLLTTVVASDSPIKIISWILECFVSCYFKWPSTGRMWRGGVLWELLPVHGKETFERDLRPQKVVWSMVSSKQRSSEWWLNSHVLRPAGLWMHPCHFSCSMQRTSLTLEIWKGKKITFILEVGRWTPASRPKSAMTLTLMCIPHSISSHALDLKWHVIIHVYFLKVYKWVWHRGVWQVV